jgi:rod shape determining protein RodA
MKADNSSILQRFGMSGLTAAVAAALIALGFLSLWGAAGRHPEASALIGKEAAWLVCGALVGFIICKRPLSFWFRAAPALYALCMAVMAAGVFLPWLAGLLLLSPDPLYTHLSEWSALPVMLVAARLVQEEKDHFLSLKALVGTLAVAGAPVALLFIPKGTTILSAYLVMLLMALFAVNVRRGVWMMLAFAVYTGSLMTAMYRMKRVIISCPIIVDSEPSASRMMEPIKSLVALSSAGVFGKGFGESGLSLCEGFADLYRQFGFAYFGEQFGFLSAALALCLFGVIVINCLRVARQVEDRGQCFMATAIGWFLGWHVFMHVGTVSMMFPAKAFLLPFFPSGPATVAFTAMVAILLRIMRYGSRDAKGNIAGATGAGDLARKTGLGRRSFIKSCCPRVTRSSARWRRLWVISALGSSPC